MGMTTRARTTETQWCGGWVSAMLSHQLSDPLPHQPQRRGSTHASSQRQVKTRSPFQVSGVSKCFHLHMRDRIKICVALPNSLLTLHVHGTEQVLYKHVLDKWMELLSHEPLVKLYSLSPPALNAYLSSQDHGIFQKIPIYDHFGAHLLTLLS